MAGFGEVDEKVKKSELDTPCLVVDLDVMENNIRDMAEFARDTGVILRPMSKTHKCPAISHIQLDAPATPGIQTAKVGEAEVMAASGIKDIFISNEIIGESKVERLVNLSKGGKISTSVDSVVGARGLNEVAQKHSVRLDVLVHVDSGNRRTGVLPGEPTLQLVREVLKFDNLNFKGIWTHEGHNYTGRDPAEVLKITMKAGEDMVETKKLVERELGVEVYNSVGSTPGAKPLAKMEGVDEIRPGAYVFYDASQVFMGVCDLKDCALTVLSAVFSTPAEDRIVCDAGSKGYYPPGEWLAFDDKGYVINWPLPSTGGGVVKGTDGEVYNEMVFHRWGEEYGIIKVYDGRREVKIGDLLEIIPFHCCSTVNLYDELFGVRDDVVEVRWPIWGRGKVL